MTLDEQNRPKDWAILTLTHASQHATVHDSAYVSLSSTLKSQLPANSPLKQTADTKTNLKQSENAVIDASLIS